VAKVYDTIIIGGGPAGLSAAQYASRGKVDTLLIERAKFGGQAVTTDEIENYPAAPKDSTGASIVARMKEQAETFGTEIVKEDVVDVDFGQREGDLKTVTCRKQTFTAKTIIIANGATPRISGFKNELKLRGRGISYCATCDADFFEELDVAVVGGGDTAVKEAIYLTKFADKVTLIHRRDQLRADKNLQEQCFANPKIEIIWDTIVEEAFGDEILEHLVLKNRNTKEVSNLEVQGCFVFVGYTPTSELFKEKVNMDTHGYILTDADMKTNVPGVFAAGDIRQKSLKQVITAAADGAIAAVMAEEFISENKQPEREA